MRKIITDIVVTAFCVLGFVLNFSTLANAKDGKENLEDRLQALENAVDSNVTFVSDGRLVLFGVEVETVPPTEQERDEREEADGQ